MSKLAAAVLALAVASGCVIGEPETAEIAVEWTTAGESTTYPPERIGLHLFVDGEEHFLNGYSGSATIPFEAFGNVAQACAHLDGWAWDQTYPKYGSEPRVSRAYVELSAETCIDIDLDAERPHVHFDLVHAE